MAEKRKSGISGKRHRSKPIPWEKNSLGKLGEEEDEEGEPAIERRRECTDLGLDLAEREDQVVCHASALALAMTDEKRKCKPVGLHHFCERQRKPCVFH